MSNLFKKSFIILGATLLFSSSVMATSIPSSETTHLGIATDTQEFYSNLNSGYFDGYMTVKANGSYKFYIKNVGYNTISVSGSTGHTAS